MPKGEVYYEVLELADLLVSKGAAVYENTPLEEDEKVEIKETREKKEIKKPTTKKNK